MKVAICGTGAGYENAPFGHEGWEVWGLSGHWNTGKKFDRVYEIHHGQSLEGLRFEREKINWMMENVTVCHPTTQTGFPNAKPIDFDRYLQKYGRYFMSTLSWMMAEAMEIADEITICGATLSANDEYAHQKPSLTYLIGWARALGIKVNTKKDSELFSAPFIYGMDKEPDFLDTIKDKRRIAEQAKDQAEHDFMASFEQKSKAQGYIECLDQFENNFWAAGKKT